MEDTRMILDLFESQEQWNAYIELANMKQAFTDELKEAGLKKNGHAPYLVMQANH